MICYGCKKPVQVEDKVFRGDLCRSCGRALHCCRNCGFYDTQAHNQCREPQAERQVDKQVGNFCEYFSFRTGRHGKAGKSDDARAGLDALFAKKK